MLPRLLCLKGTPILNTPPEDMPRVDGPKRLLQKISKVISIIFFITSVISFGLIFTFNAEDEKVYKASMGAITFFCFMVGLVLNALANANLPNLSLKEDK